MPQAFIHDLVSNVTVWNTDEGFEQFTQTTVAPKSDTQPTNSNV